MKNRNQWTPSKYVFRNGRLRASLNPKEVSISSRLSADIVAAYYDRNIRLHAKGHLLDLGCGKVPLYEAYKEYITDNTCIDWAESLHANPYLDFLADLNKNLDLAHNSFDTVILSNVLEHIRNPEKLLSEINRVLKPGGKLLMSVPFYYWLHEKPHDYFRYTEFALQSMAADAGLRVLTLEAYGGAPEIIADIVAKNVRSVRVIGKPVAVLSQKLAALLLKTGIGRKISKRTRTNFPLGYFMVAQKAT